MLRKTYIIGSIVTTCILTLGSLTALLYASHLLGSAVQAVQESSLQVHNEKPVVRAPVAISGKPIRITIPSSNIDLHIDDGGYDKTTKTWTLSETHAQFATISTVANNQKGTTFIYGHGTDAVFGKIGTNHPPVGTSAYLYADNGHVFAYKLRVIEDKNPTDTEIFHQISSGPPRLIVQTCTGMFSEWRTMFIFSFDTLS